MPALGVSELNRRIGRRELGPLHVFVGEDVRLVERMVAGVEGTIDPADQPFAVERMHAGEPGGSPLDIAAAARVFPMLGDRRIVIVLRAERILKPRRAARAPDDSGEDDASDEAETPADFGPLEDYIKAPVPSTTVVFVATEVDRGRRLTKQLMQAAEVTEFPGLGAGGSAGRGGTSGAALGWVHAEFTRIGRTIEPDAVNLLVERAGGDITKLRGDVERLLLYTEGHPAITPDDVAEVASIATDVDDWAVVNALAGGDAPRALRAAAARLDRGDSPHALVGQLRWWVSERLAGTEPDRVAPALDALLRADLALKSSAGEDRVLVERLVIELAGRTARSTRPAGQRRP